MSWKEAMHLPQFWILNGLLALLACLGTYLMLGALFNWPTLRLPPTARISSRMGSFCYGYACWCLPMMPLMGLSERYLIAKVILWSYFGGLVIMIGLIIASDLRRAKGGRAEVKS